MFDKCTDDFTPSLKHILCNLDWEMMDDLDSSYSNKTKSTAIIKYKILKSQTLAGPGSNFIIYLAV